MRILHFAILVCTVAPLLSGLSGETNASEPIQLSFEEQQKGLEVALFAGGCFWCLEPAFENLKGVTEASVGYCGGKAENASYYQVSSGGTDHLETVRIVYNPALVSYGQLLEIYWKYIDPTDGEGQFEDRGSHYTTAIFYHNEMQKLEAEHSKKTLAASGKYSQPIVTKILPARPFYLAEQRHQNFFEKKYSPVKRVNK